MARCVQLFIRFIRSDTERKLISHPRLYYKFDFILSFPKKVAVSRRRGHEVPVLWGPRLPRLVPDANGYSLPSGRSLDPLKVSFY